MATALAHSKQSVVLLVSADPSFRQRAREVLSDLCWHVVEAPGGAAALGVLAEAKADAVIVDSWLPDLDAEEFVLEIRTNFPAIELLSIDGTPGNPGSRSPRRGSCCWLFAKARMGEAPAAILRNRGFRATRA
jgi:response regulator RpfG family c-di-GMP phosphodiesterase